MLDIHEYVSENWNNYDHLLENLPFLKNELSEFETIVKYLNLLENNLDVPLTEFNSAVENLLDSQDLYVQIFSNLYPYVIKFDKILTISNSHTLLNIFKLWHKKNNRLEIFVSESRPLFEGRVLVESLLEIPLKLSLITESALSYYVENCDAAVIGADAILPTGDVINKTGSRLIAILCKHFKKPFYVAADKSKIKSDNTVKIIEKPVEEIWEHNHKSLSIKNYYFEIVENDLITKIITN